MKITLFCLPFAGGSKYSLLFFKKVLPPNITCHFLEYPGRGARLKESFANDIDEIVNDLYRKIEFSLNTPYAIYGHSMGAKVAYLLSKRICKSKNPPPLHVFVSGTDAPSVADKTTPKHVLPKDEFLAAVKELGGLPDEILEHTEMLEYFEPILRADFRASETYQYKKSSPLTIPMTVMTGENEDIEDADILEWQNETTIPIIFYKFPGNHFFIYDNEMEIGKIIVRTLVK